MVEAEDTYYEHWWGDKNDDNDEYGYMHLLTTKGYDAVPEKIKIPP